MVTHIVMWKLKDTYTNEQKVAVATEIKYKLENLSDLMDGVLKVKVIINPLATSNVDVMLLSEFDTEETLQAYQVHPEHQMVVMYIKEHVESRSCIDYLATT